METAPIAKQRDMKYPADRNPTNFAGKIKIPPLRKRPILATLQTQPGTFCRKRRILQKWELSRQPESVILDILKTETKKNFLGKIKISPLKKRPILATTQMPPGAICQEKREIRKYHQQKRKATSAGATFSPRKSQQRSRSKWQIIRNGLPWIPARNLNPPLNLGAS